jgi:hypothetical protein
MPKARDCRSPGSIEIPLTRGVGQIDTIALRSYWWHLLKLAVE